MPWGHLFVLNPLLLQKYYVSVMPQDDVNVIKFLESLSIKPWWYAFDKLSIVKYFWSPRLLRMSCTQGIGKE